MIPILYESNETVFNRNGIGFLKDCISCTVTEERNGSYETEMKYPITGQFYSEITVDRIIKVKANETSEPQLFRIYKNSKPLNGIVTYKAQHISYDLNSNPVTPFESSKANASTVLNEIIKHCFFAHNFTVMSDIDTTSSVSITTPVSARNCLGGMSGSVLDNFGGEYEFDNFVIKLHKQRGSNNGVTIEYGKNLTDINSETDISGTYTSIMPYAQDSDGKITILPEKVISLDSQNNYGCAKSKIVDLSDKFESDEEITEEKLREYAQTYLSSNAIDKIKTNIKVSFVQLWQSKEYEKYALLERVNLCDTVTVKYKALGVSAEVKVIKTVYDSLNECYDSIELGDAQSSFADTINSINSNIQTMQTAIHNQPSAMQKAINNATDIITGQKGGHIVLNPKEYPQELLIMNTDSIETATKVWRFNLGGFGYSKNGYNGPFPLAITMDGAIVADFITAGTLNADIIKAGTISDKSGNMSISMDNGLVTFNIETKGKMQLHTLGLTLYDESGNVIASIFKSETQKGVVTANRILVGKRDSETTDISEDSDGKGYVNTDKVIADNISAKNSDVIDIETVLQSHTGYRVVDSKGNKIGVLYVDNDKSKIEADSARITGSISANYISVDNITVDNEINAKNVCGTTLQIDTISATSGTANIGTVKATSANISTAKISTIDVDTYKMNGNALGSIAIDVNGQTAYVLGRWA